MTPLYGLAAAEWPLIVCEELLLGTAAFVLTAAPRDTVACERALSGFRPLWLGLALGLLAATPLAMLAEVAQMASVPMGHALRFLPEAITSTHAGFLWAWRLAGAAAIVAATLLRSSPRRAAARLIVLLEAILLLGAFASHAIDEGYATVALYFVHMTAAGLWFGAIAGLLFVMRVEPDAPWVGDAARRVSLLVGWLVLALAVSGLGVAYQVLGTNVGGLADSAYARTLVVKVALFGAALVIGCYNHYRLVPARDELPTRRSLVRAVGVECILLLAVLAAASLLANTPPPH
jgi:putative copper export protein